MLEIEGIFQNGQIELNEFPHGVKRAKVVVTFLTDDESPKANGRRITYGMFPELRQFTDEDFKLAEWHGDIDLDPEMPDAK